MRVRKIDNADPEKVKDKKIITRNMLSRALRAGDIQYEIIRRQVLDLHLTGVGQQECHELFRRATQLEEYTESVSVSSATAFFKKDENVLYLREKRKQLEKKFFDAYCKSNNIEHKDLIEKREDEMNSVLNMSPDEIREKNFRELEELKNACVDPTLRAAIIKQQTELMDAKLKKKEDTTSETDKLIHFYLPAPICDNCERRCEVESKYSHLPNVDLGLDNEEDTEEDEDE